MRTLGLITARGGSKAIPNKNIRQLGGQPLLAYCARSALAATTLERVLLSTDSEDIAAVGRAHGLEVPFMRPASLARDDTPTLPVIRHVIEELERRGERFDAICLLQPTDPLRRSEDIDACVRLLASSDADSVISVHEVPPHYNPHWVFFRGPDGGLRLSTGERDPIPRRQELPPAYHRSGSIYVTRWHVIRDQHSLYGAKVLGHLMPRDSSINLDTFEDWSHAERRLQERSE
jgi:CMP-N,N'-diacetyllegionaminic acid synthase